MAKILIPYGTTEGQTARIADYIADVLRAHGHVAETLDLRHAAHDLPVGYDGVIVGASIHAGKHEGYVADFVRRNLAALENLPAACFPSASPPMRIRERHRSMCQSSRTQPAGTRHRWQCSAARSCTPSMGSLSG